MTWVTLVPLGVALLWLWDIRRILKLRALPVRLPSAPAEAPPRPGFAGAVPPNRYVVVRWPQGRLEYAGCVGSLARQTYEHTHPAEGEEVEIWELGTRRGNK